MGDHLPVLPATQANLAFCTIVECEECRQKGKKLQAAFQRKTTRKDPSRDILEDFGS